VFSCLFGVLLVLALLLLLLHMMRVNMITMVAVEKKIEQISCE
jgi:hypothetical protein